MDKQELRKITPMVLKAVALGMGVVSLVLGFIPEVTSVDTHITLLSIGLAALAIVALDEEA